MIKTVEAYIRQEHLLHSGDKVIVGLSGGADSVVLLSMLHHWGYECLAAHCNFHLRGEESQRDEQFSAGFAASLNLSFFKSDFDTRRIAGERGISIEMAARELRYEWFEELRKTQQAEAIAVAHHQDDNIETLLLNLIRGTGLRGLTGIRPRNGCIVRPLLCISKKEILQYAEAENLPYITDSSNEQDEFTRNKIRLQLLPLLETLNPSVRESLIQTRENLNEAYKIYESGIKEACKALYNKEKRSISIPLLKKQPSPESVLFELLKNRGFKKETVRDVYRAMDSLSGKTFYSADFCLLKDRDEFLLSPLIREERNEYSILPNQTFLETPFRMKIDCRFNEPYVKIDTNADTACLDYNKLQFPLTLRKWKTGDKFIPLGMNNFQKLSDFFNNHKFSKIKKEETWILTSGQHIVWIVNHRIDDRFKITGSTKNVYILKLL
jgi:tRNA(Ile)-lysidine synthase